MREADTTSLMFWSPRRETALQEVRIAEDGWNSRGPSQVMQANTPDSLWRSRSGFLQGRDAIVAFLADKWQRGHDYRLVKGLSVHDGNRIGPRPQGLRNWRSWDFERGLLRRLNNPVSTTISTI
ncbi:DUF1348 family protein [Novosphingobium sp. BL-8A]|uniref:DUF1348 family protein n=1 Tax=Novosphingobium sp. BL-8A TaxID=3127639 RepID=UPI0037572F35